VTALSEQNRLLDLRSPQAPERERSTADGSNAPDRRWGLRLPSLRGKSALVVPTLDKTAREERAQARERERLLSAVEAAEQAFYLTPAGRARLAYKRGHQLFQYELEVNGLEPTVIPGHIGSPALQTTDPVDILNSVTVEGWKLVSGKFLHSEMRNGAVGCYLFKRSQKRRLGMNNPWQDPSVTS
jgi:hypothetical protein